MFPILVISSISARLKFYAMNYANFDYFQSTGSNSGNMLAYGPDAEVSVILTRNGGESLGIEPATKRSIHSPLTD